MDKKDKKTKAVILPTSNAKNNFWYRFDRSDLQDKTSKVIFKDGQIVTIEDI